MCNNNSPCQKYWPGTKAALIRQDRKVADPVEQQRRGGQPANHCLQSGLGYPIFLWSQFKQDRLPGFTCFSLQRLARMPPGGPCERQPWMTEMHLLSLQLQTCSHLRLAVARSLFTPWPWPSYTNLTWISWRCTKSEFLGQRFQQREHYRRTDATK